MCSGGQAEVDWPVWCGAVHLVELGEFRAGPSEADLEAFDLAEPAFAAGFLDPGEKVVADVEESSALCGVGTQQRAAQAGVFVDARGGVGSRP